MGNSQREKPHRLRQKTYRFVKLREEKARHAKGHSEIRAVAF